MLLFIILLLIAIFLFLVYYFVKKEDANHNTPKISDDEYLVLVHYGMKYFKDDPHKAEKYLTAAMNYKPKHPYAIAMVALLSFYERRTKTKHQFLLWQNMLESQILNIILKIKSSTF